MLEKKVPCPVCPYKLGMIKTLVSPCPQCRLTGYSFYYKHSKGRARYLTANPASNDCIYSHI